MLTTSKIISFSFVAFLFAFQFSKAAFATELVLNASGTSVVIVTEAGKVMSKHKDQKKSYTISKSFADHLKKSFDIKLINTYDDARRPIFFMLAREPSRPNSMGRGYCGAGYEDFLLLDKLYRKTFALNDKYLLQSCLRTKSMRIEKGRLNPEDALRLSADGSYNFEMLDDDYGKMWNLKIINGKFIIKNIGENNPGQATE